jgi:hypothetical protein
MVGKFGRQRNRDRCVSWFILCQDDSRYVDAALWLLVMLTCFCFNFFMMRRIQSSEIRYACTNGRDLLDWHVL